MNGRQFFCIAAQAVLALRAFWARSLFIIGAVGLGIASLTIILASVEGATLQANALAVKFGPTAINVMGGGIVDEEFTKRPETLTWDDIRAIEKILPGVERVSALLFRLPVTAQSKNKRHIADGLVGVGAWHGPSWGWYPGAGRDFTDADVANAENVCLLGSITAEKLFGNVSPLGQMIVVNDVPLTVIGVLTVQGLVSGDMEVDDRVTVPISTLISRFNLSRQYVTQLRVTFGDANTPEMMAAHSENLRSLLRDLHHLPKEASDDFTLITMQDILSFVDMLKGSVVIFLGTVAAVAILAGGFTLANLFYLSVADRTMEIGLKKALGASNLAIFVQFIIEALLLACCGALLGLGIGMVCGYVLNRFGLLAITFSFSVFCMSFIAACLIGVIFALKPANTAARLSPVKALKGLA